jgi:hypothetical protein
MTYEKFIEAFESSDDEDLIAPDSQTPLESSDSEPIGLEDVDNEGVENTYVIDFYIDTEFTELISICLQVLFIIHLSPTQTIEGKFVIIDNSFKPLLEDQILDKFTQDRDCTVYFLELNDSKNIDHPILTAFQVYLHNRKIIDFNIPTFIHFR